MEESPPGNCSKCYIKVLKSPELLHILQRLFIRRITPFSFVYVSITINNYNITERNTPPTLQLKSKKGKPNNPLAILYVPLFNILVKTLSR